jgi:hypothetical protein
LDRIQFDYSAVHAQFPDAPEDERTWDESVIEKLLLDVAVEQDKVDGRLSEFAGIATVDLNNTAFFEQVSQRRLVQSLGGMKS